MITFVTCWYELHSKYDKDSYKRWIDNFLSNVSKFNLVVFTNKHSYHMVEQYRENPKIRIVLRELEEFYNYRYKEQWIKNHDKNVLLNKKTCWEVNMLWNEKTHFVENAYNNQYFESDWWGWCDIGYFRGRPCDLNIDLITQWPNEDIINKLDKNKIHYGNVNGDMTHTYEIYKRIMVKNENGLPSVEIPPDEIFIAAGFFVIYEKNIAWWNDTHDRKLKLYFDNEYLVKDDQIIVLDNIVTHITQIKIHTEFSNGQYDNWFMFQRLLLSI